MGLFHFLNWWFSTPKKKKKIKILIFRKMGFYFYFYIIYIYIYIHFLVLMFSLGRWMILLKRVSQNQGKEVLNISKIEKD